MTKIPLFNRDGKLVGHRIKDTIAIIGTSESWQVKEDDIYCDGEFIGHLQQGVISRDGKAIYGLGKQLPRPD